MVVGGWVVAYVIGAQPLRNDQATLDQLRSKFAQSAWSANLVSAYWDSSDNLKVGLDSDDRQIAMVACSDLTDVVKERTGTGPDGVPYTATSSDRSLFIFGRSRHILVTNLLSKNSGCRWRLN